MEPQSKQLMTSDQDAKVVAEPQGQRVQEGKDSAHLVSVSGAAGGGRRVSPSENSLHGTK